MIYKDNKLISVSTLFLILFVSVFMMISGADNAGADADDILLPSDIEITGKMDSYSRSSITLDKVRYTLCSDVKLFSKSGRKLSFENLATAVYVKLIGNDICLRKIIVLKFAD